MILLARPSPGLHCSRLCRQVHRHEGKLFSGSASSQSGDDLRGLIVADYVARCTDTKVSCLLVVLVVKVVMISGASL